MDKPLVLSLYDLSGVMVLPWADAGYPCFIVDIQHKKGCTKHRENVWKWGVDVLTWLPPKEQYRIAFSFSPCDDMSVSGARWFQEKSLYSLGESIKMFARGLDICEWTGAPYCLEHPRSTISTYYRSPDYTCHPYYFDYLTKNDENYTKETNLWGGNGFKFPVGIKPTIVPDKTKIHYCGPSDRSNIRSATPDGFARAVFIANEGNCGS